MPRPRDTFDPTLPTELVARAADLNKRLDRFVCENLPALSRSQIQKMIAKGAITVNGSLEKPNYRVRGGEKVQVSQPELTASPLIPEAIPLDIVYEDEDLAVINKPAGLVVHSGAGVRSGTLVNALLYHFQQLSSSGCLERPGIVHRLDKQTSGLMLVAKNDWTHQHLTRQFQARQILKKYKALVHGVMQRDYGEITSPIGRDRIHRTKMTTRAAHSREAYTQYILLERFPYFTLLELHIKTGRTHQIRVHLSSIKHPVVGDTLYGAPPKIQSPDQPGLFPTLPRNFLHASRLEFQHPRSLELMSFQSNLPNDLEQFLDRLRQAKKVIKSETGLN